MKRLEDIAYEVGARGDGGGNWVLSPRTLHDLSTAIIAAHTAKLLAGVEMPEPARKTHGAIDTTERHWFSADQLQAYAAPAAQPCKVCEDVHAILDADESMIIRDAKDGYPEGRASRTLTLQERVKALCVYAADWKRWYEETQAAPAPQKEKP